MNPNSMTCSAALAGRRISSNDSARALTEFGKRQKLCFPCWNRQPIPGAATAAALSGDAGADRRLAAALAGARRCESRLEDGVRFTNLKIIFNSKLIVSQSGAGVNRRYHAQM